MRNVCPTLRVTSAEKRITTNAFRVANEFVKTLDDRQIFEPDFSAQKIFIKVLHSVLKTNKDRLFCVYITNIERCCDHRMNV